MPGLNARMMAMVNSLGSRLAQVSLLAAVPLFLLLVFGALEDRDHALASARAHVLELARLGARQQDELVLETANLVRTLARVPDVAAMTAGACHAILRQLDDDHPQIDGISVARPDGTIGCTSRAGVSISGIADRPYFRAAMVPDAPPYVVSEPLTSRGNGKPSVVVAAPLPALPGQRPAGIVVAVVGLEWFAQLARLGATPADIAAPPPPGPGPAEFVVQLLDSRSATILAQSPADAVPSISYPVLSALRSARGEGTVDAPDQHGVKRLYGFVPLPGLRAGLVLAVGLDQEAVLAQADARLRRGVALALVAMSVAVLLAMAFARWSLLRPIAALAAAAGRLGTGDLVARARVGARVAPELRALSAAFNAMADRLAAREASLAAIQARLADSEVHHRVLAEAASDMITRFGPDFRRIYISPACRDLIGYAPEELVGHQPGGIVHPDDWPLLDATLNRPLQRGESTSRATYRALHKDGHAVWLESIGRRLPDGEGFVVVTRDVSARIELEDQLRAANEKLEALVMQDGLTGLANRRCFDAVLLQELRQAERKRTPLAVAVIDIDYFKKYNDTYGHPAGDQCLRTVAKAIAGALRRSGDLAARWGGKEFVALLPGTDAARALHMAEAIRTAVEALGLPHANGVDGHVTVSVGAAALNLPVATDGPALIAAADAALYAAKQSGRNVAMLGGATAAPGGERATTGLTAPS